MNTATVFLLMASVLAPPVKTSAERSTRIYVRTIPPGASVVLDGKELGTTDGLFLVPPGVRTITLEMDGYDPKAERVDVREGWITRVEVRLEQKLGSKGSPAREEPSAAVSRFKEQLTQDRAKLKELLAHCGEHHPEVMKLRARVMNAEAALSLMKGEEPDSKTAEIRLERICFDAQGIPVIDGKPATLQDVHAQLSQLEHPEARRVVLVFSAAMPFSKSQEILTRTNAWKDELHLAGVSVAVARDEAGISEAARSILLPDADTKDASVVLDLASGEMLKLPWKEELEGDATFFTRLGKGDLGFDSELFCLRGGEVALVKDDGSVEPIRVTGRKDDAKIYRLPNIPCQLIVTTAEKREFVVKVLEKTAKGGLKLEYREKKGGKPAKPLVTAVAPQGEQRARQSNVPAEVKAQVKVIETAVELYRLDTGSYPKKLEMLLTPPEGAENAKAWSGPYLKSADGGEPVDPWGDPYLCVWGGKGPDRYLGIASSGPDGKFRTEDDVLSFEPEEARTRVPASDSGKQASQEAAENGPGSVLELCICANEEEAKAFEKSGSKDLGWYTSVMEEKNPLLVTREVDGRKEILLWKTADKSLVAAGPEEKPWRVIEVSVIAEPDKPGRIGVVFDVEGGRRMRQLTTANIDRRLAVLVDGRVVACPIVRSPMGERVEITGNFSKADLNRMATALQAGMEAKE